MASSIIGLSMVRWFSLKFIAKGDKTMKAQDLKFISDAGHGWLKVPLELGLPLC